VPSRLWGPWTVVIVFTLAGVLIGADIALWLWDKPVSHAIPVVAGLFIGALIPVFVWVQKPINRLSACPHCGSKDFRRSYVAGTVDQIRGLLGIHAFRCRGCTRRFFGRDEAVGNGEEHANLGSESFK
jgi:hypothetical protein